MKFIKTYEGFFTAVGIVVTSLLGLKLLSSIFKPEFVKLIEKFGGTDISNFIDYPEKHKILYHKISDNRIELEISTFFGVGKRRKDLGRPDILTIGINIDNGETKLKLQRGPFQSYTHDFNLSREKIEKVIDVVEKYGDKQNI